MKELKDAQDAQDIVVGMVQRFFNDLNATIEGYNNHERSLLMMRTANSIFVHIMQPAFKIAVEAVNEPFKPKSPTPEGAKESE